MDRLEDLAGRTRPVDLEAFRNLVDPREETFYVPACRRASFARSRGNACEQPWTMSGTAAHNAACLLSMGEAAHADADPRIAQAGRQLIDSALRLRAYALLSSVKLYVRMVFPEARLSYGQNGRQLSASQRFGQSAYVLMQHPTQAARLSALL